MFAERYPVKWLCENIWRRLKAGKKLYLLLIGEMMFGSAILLICMNIFFTEEGKLKEYAKTTMTQKASVMYETGESVLDEMEEAATIWNAPSISYEMAQMLVSEYGEEFELLFSNLFILDMFLPEKQCAFALEVYCMDDLFFADLFLEEESAGQDRSQKAYLGADVYEFLEMAGEESDDKVFSTGYRFWIRDGMLWVNGEPLFEAAKIEEINQKKIESIPEVWGDGMYELGKAVILPFAFSQEMESMLEESERFFLVYTQLKIGSPQGVMDFTQLNRLLGYLTALSDNKITFRLSDRYLEVEKEYEDIKSLLWYWSWIGGAFSVMVLCGAVGVLILLQYRRRKSTIIQYFCGATKRELYAELFCEILLVLFCGTALGVLAAYLVLPHIQIGIEIQWHFRSVGTAAGLAAVISLIAFSITYLVDKNKKYLEQIKEG